MWNDNVPAAVSLAEAQAYARVETGEEEALLAGLLRSATALCEQFIGQRLIARAFALDVAGAGEWRRLPLTPVTAIDEVARVDGDGVETVLDPGDYAIDVDVRGDGWVRVVNGSAGRLRVHGVAGGASDANGVPEPLRQGILRLVAHLFASRDEEGGEPPAAVTALWRPYRRVRLS